ncbi:hypothetical protein, partial [Paraprevotella clara]|uniref:hypothetical protein n=1 Tax=Paraprevotella clara TaxID=454154 RepID=UPI00266F83F4
CSMTGNCLFSNFISNSRYVTVKGLTKAFSCHIFAGGKHNRKHKAYGLQKDCMHRHKTVE